MSLVGSLEDLGLGEILQIISLSGKSGLLQLRADGGQGRILFDDGRIRLAFLGAKEPTHATMGLAAPVPEGGDDTAVREWVERAVFQMFSWSAGEFSFEVCDIREHGDAALFLDPGINPQFLALEGTRMADEAAAGFADGAAEAMGFGAPMAGQATVIADPADETGTGGSPLDLPADPFADVSPEPVLQEAPVLAAKELSEVAPPELPEAEFVTEPEPGAGPTDVEPARVSAEAPPVLEFVAPSSDPASPRDTLAEAPPATSTERVAPVVATGPSSLPPLVLVDPDLAVVEWTRASLPEGFPAAHLFQSTDQGIHRIRQYLRRAEVPLVVLSTDLPPDGLSGARTPEELLQRLHKQAPQMRILLLQETGRPLPQSLEALGIHQARLSRPTATQLADPRQWEGLVRLGREFASGLLGACGVTAPRAEEGADVQELRQASEDLRASALGGEVLSKVLEFARRSFSRVALFMICDDQAQGIAQAGLPLAGGPSDDAFREAAFPFADSSWIAQVVSTRSPLRVPLDAAPDAPGDRRFLDLLGEGVPAEGWLGPILSTDRVFAVLYGDQLPNQAPIGDTAALEVILHHAGLSLDRAALERVLSDPSS